MIICLKHISVILTIIISGNIYSQWVVCSGTVNGIGSYPTISVPNCSTVVLAGGTTGFPRGFRSTNSGASFDNITGNLSGPELFCVWAKSRDTIFVGDGGSVGGLGGNAKVWKTVDGGGSWTNILSTGGSSGFINGMRFTRPDQKYGIIVSDPPSGSGTPFLSFKTANGGASWTNQSIPGVSGSVGS